MSDVHTTVTTPPSAPAAPAAAPAAAPVTEVPVNESPVTTQTPLGSQAPPKPPGQESNKTSHVSRKEALAQAFERSKKDQDDAAKNIAPKRAKPGMGHNQPPEAMEREDAKKPQAQPDQYREGGRFARDPNRIEQGQQAQAPQTEQQKLQHPQLDPNAKFREPPQRFSDQAKAEWSAAPESVRGAVHHMARQFQGAYEKYRGDYEVMETLRPYHDLAQKQGTTLERAFTNYFKMEQKLRSDIIGGLDVIVQNMKMQHPDGTPVTLRDVAYHITNMSPEQHQMTVQQNQQSAADMRIGQLHQIVEKLTQNVGQLHYQQQFKDKRAEIDAFAETHPRLDELGAAIKQELDLGFSLPVAYARADRLYPSNTAAQTRNTSAQTRRTSISGAPDGGKGQAANTRPSAGQRPSSGNGQYPSRREALAKAMRSVSNGI